MKFNSSDIKEIIVQFSDGHTAKIKNPREIGFEVHRDTKQEVLVMKYDRENFHMNW